MGSNRPKGPRSDPTLPELKVRRKKNLGAGVGSGFPSSSRLNDLVTRGNQCRWALANWSLKGEDGLPSSPEHTKLWPSGVRSRRSKPEAHSRAVDATPRAFVPRLRKARPAGCADRKPGDTGVRAALSAPVTSLLRLWLLPHPHLWWGVQGPGKGRAQRGLRSPGVKVRRGAAGLASVRCVLLSPRPERSRTWASGGGSLWTLLSSNSVPLLTSGRTWGRSPHSPASETVELACAERAGRLH